LLVPVRGASRHRQKSSALLVRRSCPDASSPLFFLSFHRPSLSTLHAVSYSRHRRVHRSQSAETRSRVCFCFVGVSSACLSCHVQPNAIAHTMMRTLRKISGTIVSLTLACCFFHVSSCPRMGRRHSLRISVRTEFMRLIVFALTLAPSCAPPPKEGSFCAALPQPTVLCDC
jgi:hypothetical protein